MNCIELIYDLKRYTQLILYNQSFVRRKKKSIFVFEQTSYASIIHASYLHACIHLFLCAVKKISIWFMLVWFEVNEIMQGEEIRRTIQIYSIWYDVCICVSNFAFFWLQSDCCRFSKLTTACYVHIQQRHHCVIGINKHLCIQKSCTPSCFLPVYAVLCLSHRPKRHSSTYK